MEARKKLKQARIDSGYTQEALAALIGVDARQVRSWESGRSTPRPYARRKLSEILKKSPEELDLVEELGKGNAEVNAEEKELEESRDTSGSPEKHVSVPPHSQSPLTFHSCFISCSSNDQVFAEQLYADLRRHGVSCWFAPHQMKIGDKIRASIDRSIRATDKLLLILSKHSVTSSWVETEVEAAFEQERRQKKLVLFPIRIDESVMQTTEAWAADIRRTRHIGDFRGWENPHVYQQALARLLRDLEVLPSSAGNESDLPFPVSRRLVLGSLAGLAITGGGLAWFTLLQRSASINNTPLGTVFSTYHGHSDLVSSVAWSPNSNRIASASADKTVQVWNAVDGGQVYTYRGHSDFVYAVAWSPDGRRIASGSSDGTVQVWDAADGTRITTYRGHANAEFGAQSVAWSPDSTHIASGGSDGTVQVWRAADGGQIFTYHGYTLGNNALEWSPDGKSIAFGGSENTVQVWNTTNSKLIFTYHGHSKPVKAVAWSPDGKSIASGSSDNTVQVWGAIDGKRVSTYRGHTYEVTGVAWSPDGKRLVSGSGDTTVRMWNASNAQQIYVYTGHSNPVSVVRWSPDGRCIASGDSFPAHGTVQVWSAG